MTGDACAVADGLLELRERGGCANACDRQRLDWFFRRWRVGRAAGGGVTGGGVDGAGGEDGGFEQGVGGDAVCAVSAGGGDLTGGEEAGDCGAAVQVGPDAAHVIVRGGRDGDRAGGEVVAALEAALVDAGEAGAEEIGRLV